MAPEDSFRMKHRLRNILGFTTIAAGLCAPLAVHERADAASPSYSIYCRGGQGRAEFHLSPAGVTTEKQFLHASAPYNAETLRPSTCAWPDRAMRPNEAARLLYARPFDSGRDRITVRTNMQLQLARHGNRKITERPLPSDMAAVNRLQDPNYIVEFRVHSDSVVKQDRTGNKRTLNVLKVDEVGVVRQIGVSDRG